MDNQNHQIFCGGRTNPMKEEYKTQLIEALSEETKLIKETEDKLKMNLNFIQQDWKDITSTTNNQWESREIKKGISEIENALVDEQNRLRWRANSWKQKFSPKHRAEDKAMESSCEFFHGWKPWRQDPQGPISVK